MVTVTGKGGVDRFFAQLPGDIRRKLLRGAGRAGANVIAEEARDRVISSEVRGAIKVKVEADDTKVTGRVIVQGKGSYIAPWLEYGTRPHLISVDASQSGGRTAARINQTAKTTDTNHSLVIGGEFVGATVLHPGARPHPFIRPALDIKGAEAVSAAQGYINSRVGKAGILGASEGEG